MIKKINYKIVDNFINEKDFKILSDTMLNNKFSWYCGNDGVSGTKNDGIYFTHNFYDSYKPQSTYIHLLNPILKKLDAKAYIRIKANLYPKTYKIYEHGGHADYDYKHKSFIFYINTNNGFTKLENGVKIKSVRNRGLFFDSYKNHNSSTCSDKDRRVNINFNYF
jgi:hypothetical protein|tara:strand:+ start:4586 stop:5080 length:495 start_codon:yes stop_codon:yes gene_type:complete